MKIDLTREPPADIFRHRGLYILISVVLLALALGGLGLMAYGFLSDTPTSENLETVALALFAGPAVIFVYFGGKLQAYKKLNPKQEIELAELADKHPLIATYCGLVAREGRRAIHAEYEACKDLDEDLTHQREQADRQGKQG
jgi:hypothetical protein